MNWRLSNRFDPAALPLADRHYNRQKPGTPQFVPPGRCVVLTAGDPVTALWVTSWPFKQYTKHQWAGAWICSAFRREGGARASELIREAVAITRAIFGIPPALGMITFIDRRKVPPLHTRRGDIWGYTYRKAGFREVGESKKNRLLCLQLLPEDMPAPMPKIDVQLPLFGQHGNNADL